MAAARRLAGIILLGTILAPQEIVSATGPISPFNIQTQTGCEAEMLGNMGAREVFSGKAYDVLTEIARAYGRAIPHIYVFPGSWNMAYLAGSTAVDGRGKIMVGQEAIERFHTIALKGFLGHEMAHLITDSAAQGCNDYILRDPQMEANADALAARALGRRPVRAFLRSATAMIESTGMVRGDIAACCFEGIVLTLVLRLLRFPMHMNKDRASSRQMLRPPLVFPANKVTKAPNCKSPGYCSMALSIC